MKFEEILVGITLISGLVWWVDAQWLRRRRSGRAKEPWWVDYARSFFPVLLLVLVLRSFVVEPFRIPSGSMKPTFLEGDFVLVNKYDYGLRLPILGTQLISIGKPERGDVVVFRHTGRKDLIKRVVGLPGDRILFKDNVLYINGEPMKLKFKQRALDFDAQGAIWPVEEQEEALKGRVHDVYLQESPAHRYYRFNDVVVPKDSYFVMGDNRNNSDDSRYWGFMQDKDLIGRAFAIWMSWDGQSFDIRWNRIGKKII